MRSTSVTTSSLLPGPALHFEPHASADLRELARQMDQGAFRADVFGRAFGHDVSAVRFVPFSAHFKRGQIAWSGSMIDFRFDPAWFSTPCCSRNRARVSTSWNPRLGYDEAENSVQFISFPQMD